MKHSVIVSACLVFAVSMPAMAQEANAQKALQKAQFMLRQATNEKAQLQVQIAALQQQVDQLARELDSVKSGSTAAQQRTEQKYSSAVAQWKQRDGEVSAELAATREQLQQQIAQRRAVEEKLQREAKNFAACYENNKKLHDINRQLLSRYESKGFLDVLTQKEPFTGTAQVEVENLLQDYRYELDDLLIEPERIGHEN